jgi:hypothetical protein
MLANEVEADYGGMTTNTHEPAQEDKGTSMPPDNQIHLTVIVSGTSISVTVNPHQKVEQLVREALRESGNQGQSPESWELRRESGEVLDQNARLGDVGLSDGDILTLQPRVGAGG